MSSLLILAGSLAGLPILLHLLMKQEPKRLIFPALRFLQVRQKQNQRKLRIRHWLLLALRCALIALFGIALFQPIAKSKGILALGGEQPIAACLIIDRSPSMGYRTGTATRMSEAIRRAMELLDDLPTGSRVAVIDPADPAPGWELTVADARTRLETYREPIGVAVPVTVGLASAYQLLKSVDQENESTDPLPRLVAVFTDRTTACWEAARSEELKTLRDSVPAPAVAHAVFDVGVDQPANVAIVNAEMSPQVIPSGQTARITVTVAATGPEVSSAVVVARIDDKAGDRKAVPLIKGGGSQAVVFEFSDLARGVHRVEFTLETDDNLSIDNARYLTFKVAEPRLILTITDDPADADFWSIAHAAKSDFECVIKKPGEVTEIGNAAVVCLLNVAEPPKALWDLLREMTARGGKLLLMPGPNARQTAYAVATNDLLPGTLRTLVKTVNRESDDPRYDGVMWRIDDALRHPLFAEYDLWRRQGNVEVVRNPRRYWQYWDVEPAPGANVVVAYDDDDVPEKRRPAILERAVGMNGGRIVMMTSRLDPQYARDDSWNDFWRSPSSAVTWSHQLAQWLAGKASDAVLNFQTGDAIPLPKPKNNKLQITGPGVTVRDTDLTVGLKPGDDRLPATRTILPGSFSLAGEQVKDGFSLNIPATESILDKVEVPAIEGLTGPNSVVPVERAVNFRDLLETKFNQPVELFPWLIVLTLLLLAAEGVVANRFYKRS